MTTTTLAMPQEYQHVETSKKKRVFFSSIFLFLIYVVLIIKVITIQSLDNSLLFTAYSVLVSAYILSRFFLSYFYIPKEVSAADKNYLPHVSFVIPSKNEGENIYKTLLTLMGSKYPKNRMEIIAINDGSTDNTSEQMHLAAEQGAIHGVDFTVVDWEKNRGKRDGMAEGVRRAKGEIVVFVDSDSFLSPTATREMVKYFIDPNVAAVAGHADVHNAYDNLLTKMQAVRYFVAFKAYKSAEALFGTVTCCSGCCSAYRTEYVKEILDEWQYQEFLGMKCTYGDDRALTNYLLDKGYRTVYAPEATSTTIVPNTWRKFLKQQLRWKKSWTRESLRASLFMWKRNPVMAVSFFLGVILPLLSPIIVGRALLWLPFNGLLPLAYLSGLVLMSMVYGLYYRLYRKGTLWIYGMFFSWFYTLILVWQLPYAIATLRDSRWGTR